MGAISQGLKSFIGKNKLNTLIGVTTLPTMFDDYEENRANGHGKTVSGISAAFNYAMPMAMNLKQFTAFSLLSNAGEIAKGLQEANDYGRKLNASKYAHAFDGAQFNDTDQVHTMREAGMAMLQKSKYNTQMALMGNEAKYMYK